MCEKASDYFLPGKNYAYGCGVCEKGGIEVAKKPGKNETLKSQKFQTLMRRLSRAGFEKGFVRPALLPDWWDETCDQDPELLPDFEMRVARFMGLPLSFVRDPDVNLIAPSYSGAQLRRVRDIDGDRLAPAIHAAIQIAGAVARNLRDPELKSVVPDSDGLVWREEIQRVGSAIKLDDMLADLWLRGIPVVPLEILPIPSFQAITCIAEGRPVILISYKHDEPGRVAFLIAHETGHIAGGDCTSEHPVVDEEDGILDETDIETKADRFARRVLVGSDSIPTLEGGEFKQLANDAISQEKQTGADAGAIIGAWAARTRDYSKATMALKALYRNSGARQQVFHHFNTNVDIEDASDSDRNLLRCVYGESLMHEVIG